MAACSPTPAACCSTGTRTRQPSAARLRWSTPPGIAEPFPVLTLKQIVREELAFAGQRPNREHVDTVLDELGLRDYVDTAVQRVPTAVRIRLLVELALLRDGVTGIVITSPERHGGAVEDWFQVVRDVARRGVTVVLVTSKAAAATVEHLLETIETHDEVETHDDVATPGVATPGVAETLEQPQTEDPGGRGPNRRNRAGPPGRSFRHHSIRNRPDGGTEVTTTSLVRAELARLTTDPARTPGVHRADDRAAALRRRLPVGEPRPVREARPDPRRDRGPRRRRHAGRRPGRLRQGRHEGGHRRR
ncbi:hypothetical protein Q9Q99_16015 [Curtobacterium flaccumfaciens]|nr:hypothetical protein Q9Q99_16015 [Curtobacterium flaccumfaciens]